MNHERILVSEEDKEWAPSSELKILHDMWCKLETQS
jgi:hypothetical protein